MRVWKKNRIFKKYHDEIWGSVINKSGYNYTKKLILLNYKTYLKRRRYKQRFRYMYFKFFKQIFLSKSKFIVQRRLLFFRKFIDAVLLKHQWYKIGRPLFTRPLFGLNKFFRLKRTRARMISRSKSSIDSKNLSRPFLGFKNANISICSIFLKGFLYKKTLSTVTSSAASFSSYGWNTLLFTSNLKRPSYALDLYKYKRFYKDGLANHLIKRKFNLRRGREFFYCVHIASPEKKKKKWSLFGLKKIYYRKVSAFFGFSKPSQLFRLYSKVKGVKDLADLSFFMLLEGRLETILYRVNFLPSVYFIKRFILAGFAFVNGCPVKHASFNLKPGDLLTIHKNKHREVYSFLKFRLKRKGVFLNYPRYVEVDYMLMAALVVSLPANYDHMTRSMSFDLYTNFLSFSK